MQKDNAGKYLRVFLIWSKSIYGLENFMHMAYNECYKFSGVSLSMCWELSHCMCLDKEENKVTTMINLWVFVKLLIDYDY